MALVQDNEVSEIQSTDTPPSKTLYGFPWEGSLVCIPVYIYFPVQPLFTSAEPAIMQMCTMSLYMLVLLNITFPFSSLTSSSLKPAHALPL